MCEYTRLNTLSRKVSLLYFVKAYSEHTAPINSGERFKADFARPLRPIVSLGSPQTSPAPSLILPPTFFPQTLLLSVSKVGPIQTTITWKNNMMAKR